jgi:hypothetical protein
MPHPPPLPAASSPASALAAAPSAGQGLCGWRCRRAAGGAAARASAARRARVRSRSARGASGAAPPEQGRRMCMHVMLWTPSAPRTTRMPTQAAGEGHAPQAGPVRRGHSSARSRRLPHGDVAVGVAVGVLLRLAPVLCPARSPGRQRQLRRQRSVRPSASPPQPQGAALRTELLWHHHLLKTQQVLSSVHSRRPWAS